MNLLKAVINALLNRPSSRALKRTRRPGAPRQTILFTAEQILAKRMTNWQNSQWLRAGADPEEIEFFANLRRGNSRG
jgi:hypothetical protein